MGFVELLIESEAVSGDESDGVDEASPELESTGIGASEASRLSRFISLIVEDGVTELTSSRFSLVAVEEDCSEKLLPSSVPFSFTEDFSDEGVIVGSSSDSSVIMIRG